MTSAELLTLTTIVGTAIGFALKRWPEFKTRAIPLTLLAFALLKNLLVSAGLLPAEVTLAGWIEPTHATVALAGFAWGKLGALILSALLETFAAVGAHSAAKNTLQLRTPARAASRR